MSKLFSIFTASLLAGAVTTFSGAAAQEVSMQMQAQGTKAPLLVHFSATVPQGLRVRWLFGDGQQAEGLKVSHTFYKPGNHTIATKILDPQGNVIGGGQMKLKVNSAGKERATVTVLLSPQSIRLGAEASISYGAANPRFWLDGRPVRGGVELITNTGKHSVVLELLTTNGPKRKSLGFSLPKVQTSSAFELEVIRLTNQARSEGWNCDTQRKGGRALPPLKRQPQLDRAATAQSMALASLNFFSHTSALDGSQPHHRVWAAGWRPNSVAENIASGQTTAAEAVTSWLKSLGHCRNIMGNYTHIGVGVVLRPSHGGPFWTQVFAKQ